MYRQSAGVANIRIAVMAGLLIFAATHAVAAIERISLGMSGMQPDDHCFSPAVSANGRFVGFVSRASNLVPGDTNNRWDVFVHDRQTGETTRVSLGPGGVELNGDSESPSLSADGRYVAFQSRADNAVPNDTNAVSDIFLYDRQTGQTTRVSRAGDGGEPNEESIRPSLTPDGRRVVFVSGASNLVAALDDDNQYDVFVRDLPTATNMLVTVSSSGENVFGFNGSISDDGRFVAFVGDVPALGPITGEGGAVFLRDLEAGTTVGVSYSNSGALIAAEGGFMLSGDGAFIAFDVRNQPVIDEDTNRHVYVRDLVSSITSRVSISTLGSPANRPSTRATRPTISRDGRFVAFTSDASNLVEGDDNERHDVFLRDRQNSTTVRISETAGGTEGDNHSSDAKISSNGELLVFSSEATNLVAGDTNGTFDIFAVEISPSNTPIGTDVVVTEGAVTVTFPAITSEGETEIVSIDPSTAGTLPGGYTLDDLSTAVQITTTAAYIPPIQVCFVANTTDPVVFDSLRILHNEGGVLVDRTVSRDFNSKKVCAAVNSLSPFVLVRFTEPPNQSPVAICRDLELQAGLVCDAATPAADELDGGSFDPEGGALTLSIGTSGPLGLGSHIITLTATDPRGASSNCQATITVVDQTPPSINVPSDVVLNATSPAGAVVNYSVSAADNCMASFTCSPASGSTFAIGTTQVNCTASDAAPNVTSGNFSVQVKGAAEQLADLIEFVATHFGAQFPPATKNQLLAFLREPSNNPNNVDHTCQSLNLFIVVVRSRAGTPGLPASDASQLITDAQRIRAVLNCR